MKDQRIISFFKLLQLEPELLDWHSPTVFLRAVVCKELANFDKDKLLCVQTLKTRVEELEKAGFKTSQTYTGKFRQAVYLGTNHKLENLYNFKQLTTSLEDQGLLIVAMDNDHGAKRFEKNLKLLLGEVESFSKNHCRVFYGRKTDLLNQELLAEWSEYGNAKQIDGTELWSQPGIFSWDRIDLGSRILIEQINTPLTGHGADFGAGYGYLSTTLLNKFPNITIDLYEDENLALSMAKKNLAGKLNQVNFYWHDLNRPVQANKYNWIVCNPPFHSGKTVDTSLGQQFIKNACSSLMPGGAFYMVANQHLPYNKVLEQNFANTIILAKQKGFIVYKSERHA